ncbi:hypothetical protein DFH07DRAFT_960883 [Mycena maculata]|uniref:Uncharacterized protein n=1 Tax=Mycena maculata TaxID=230809 RepID=A0AAD7IVP1_9AGAR|nr:hypothetical protein DFH07DRAFT_960883 [Mycena maculata]
MLNRRCRHVVAAIAALFMANRRRLAAMLSSLSLYVYPTDAAAMSSPLSLRRRHVVAALSLIRHTVLKVRRRRPVVVTLSVCLPNKRRRYVLAALSVCLPPLLPAAIAALFMPNRRRRHVVAALSVCLPPLLPAAIATLFMANRRRRPVVVTLSVCLPNKRRRHVVAALSVCLPPLLPAAIAALFMSNRRRHHVVAALSIIVPQANPSDASDLSQMVFPLPSFTFVIIQAHNSSAFTTFKLPKATHR